MELWPGYLTPVLVIVLFSAFVKCITTFSILRYGIGLQGPGFGLALAALALVLTCLVLAPQLEQSGGLEGLFKNPPQSMGQLEERFGPLLEKHTQPALRDRFAGLAERLRGQAAPQQSPVLGHESRFAALASAYIVSQVSDAFHLGFLLLIPFFVIDLLIANVLLLLGATQMPQPVVALPLKILLFFAIDGWTLLCEKLVGGYA